jgi:hypothetical protein
MHSRSIVRGAVTVALALAPAVARADDVAVTHSVQCLLVVSSLATSQDAQAKLVGMMATNFFAGMIFGAAPDIDLTTAMRHEAPLLDDTKAKALLAQCGGEMKGRGDQITAAGQALQADAARGRPSS